MMKYKHSEKYLLKHKHQRCGTQVYRCWINMRVRCVNLNHKQYKDYGGRGISVCEEWLDFETFYRDMGDMPQGMSIDRIDNNKGYCKENCKWSTRQEQCENRRTNLSVSYKGQTITFKELLEQINIDRDALYHRIFRYNWPEEMWSKPLLIRNRVYKRKAVS